jgi:hypothetical protein
MAMDVWVASYGKHLDNARPASYLPGTLGWPGPYACAIKAIERETMPNFGTHTNNRNAPQRFRPALCGYATPLLEFNGFK